MQPVNPPSAAWAAHTAALSPSSLESNPDFSPLGVSLTFKDLAFTAKLPGGEPKVILEPCSGHLPGGQLVAVMGPSGCGKTTLLDMLAMKKTASYSGQVFINGHARNASLYPRIAAYVSQEDEMPAYWKVREALEFNVALKRQPGASCKAAAEFIDVLLETFGLTGVAGTYIGGAQVRGISGGQRRRVTLARGVAANASLLFCDEPTSGLSAADAELCVRALHDIATRMGVLVMVVIHQPRREVARLFDTLVLLTSNPGRMVYFGSMEGAPAYMEACGHPVAAQATNPVDFLLDLVTPGVELDAVDSLVEAFARRQQPALERQLEEALVAKGPTARQMLHLAHCRALSDDESPTSSSDDSDGGFTMWGRARLGSYAVPFHTQVAALLRRRARLTLRNPAAISVQVGMPALIGLLIGCVYKGVWQSRSYLQVVFFIYIMFTMITLNSLPLMPTFVQERGYLKRETSERLYTVIAHQVTVLLITVPLSFVGAICEVVIAYILSGLPFDYFHVFVTWCLLLFLVFDALFQWAAAVAPDGEQALSLALPFQIVFMLLNGLMVKESSAPFFLRWVFEISPTSYAMEAIFARMREDTSVFDFLGYAGRSSSKGMAVIACMVLVLRVLQVLALKHLNKLRK